MTKEIYLKQYQEARGKVTMPGEPMWVDKMCELYKWEVCVKFDSLSEAQAFRNEIIERMAEFGYKLKGQE